MMFATLKYIPLITTDLLLHIYQHHMVQTMRKGKQGYKVGINATIVNFVCFQSDLLALI